MSQNDMCDCCAKSWTDIPNAFGICHCWCEKCDDELKICKYACPDSVENTDEINEMCDCCVKSWTDIPNEFGICHCRCSECWDELKICRYTCAGWNK